MKKVLLLLSFALILGGVAYSQKPKNRNAEPKAKQTEWVKMLEKRKQNYQQTKQTQQLQSPSETPGQAVKSITKWQQSPSAAAAYTFSTISGFPFSRQLEFSNATTADLGEGLRAFLYTFTLTSPTMLKFTTSYASGFYLFTDNKLENWYDGGYDGLITAFDTGTYYLAITNDWLDDFITTVNISVFPGYSYPFTTINSFPFNKSLTFNNSSTYDVYGRRSFLYKFTLTEAKLLKFNCTNGGYFTVYNTSILHPWSWVFDGGNNSFYEFEPGTYYLAIDDGYEGDITTNITIDVFLGYSYPFTTIPNFPFSKSLTFNGTTGTYDVYGFRSFLYTFTIPETTLLKFTCSNGGYFKWWRDSKLLDYVSEGGDGCIAAFEPGTYYLAINDGWDIGTFTTNITINTFSYNFTTITNFPFTKSLTFNSSTPMANYNRAFLYKFTLTEATPLKFTSSNGGFFNLWGDAMLQYPLEGGSTGFIAKLEAGTYYLTIEDGWNWEDFTTSVTIAVFPGYSYPFTQITGFTFSKTLTFNTANTYDVYGYRAFLYKFTLTATTLLKFTGSNGGYFKLWSDDKLLNSINEGEDGFISPLVAGTYYLSIDDRNGYGDFTTNIAISIFSYSFTPITSFPFNKSLTFNDANTVDVYGSRAFLYKFTLTEATRLKFTSTNGGYFNLYEDDKLLDWLAGGDGVEEDFSVALNPKTYYLMINDNGAGDFTTNISIITHGEIVFDNISVPCDFTKTFNETNTKLLFNGQDTHRGFAYKFTLTGSKILHLKTGDEYLNLGIFTDRYMINSLIWGFNFKYVFAPGTYYLVAPDYNDRFGQEGEFPVRFIINDVSSSVKKYSEISYQPLQLTKTEYGNDKDLIQDIVSTNNVTPVAAYKFTAQTGKKYRINFSGFSAESMEFNVALLKGTLTGNFSNDVLKMVDCRFETQSTNLVYLADKNGDINVLFRFFAPTENIFYSVMVEEVSAATPTVTTLTNLLNSAKVTTVSYTSSLAFAQFGYFIEGTSDIVTGESNWLQESSGEKYYAKAYKLTGMTAGKKVKIHCHHSKDAILYVYKKEGSAFTKIDENDNWQDKEEYGELDLGYNWGDAYLEFTADSNIDYYLVATTWATYESSNNSIYKVSIWAGATEPTAAGSTIVKTVASTTKISVDKGATLYDLQAALFSLTLTATLDNAQTAPVINNPFAWTFNAGNTEAQYTNIDVPSYAIASSYQPAKVDIEYTDVGGVGGKTINALSLYLNPVSEMLNITGLAGSETINIVDITGKILISAKATGETATFAVGSLAQGTYIVTVQNSNEMNVLKFVK